MSDFPLPSTPYTFGSPWPDSNSGLAYADVIKTSTKRQAKPPFSSPTPFIHSASPNPNFESFAPSETTTLLDFYSFKYPNSAPAQGWIQRIRNGQIMVDGVVVTDPETVLRTGSELVYQRLPWKEPSAPYLLQVLYEDEDMIAVNKPSGLQVLPGGLFQQRTVLTQLQWHFSFDLPKNAAVGGLHPVPVHRLGRGTSGILLCAKIKLAKSHLSAYFAEGTSAVKESRVKQYDDCKRGILKVYRALVQGIINGDEVIIEQPIGVMHYPGVAKGLYVASLSGKPAFSKLNVLERRIKEDSTIVQVEIHSGRPHQIRIHLAFIGHPLVGDPLYVIGGQPNCSRPTCEDGSFAHDGGYNRPANAVPGDCGYHLHAHQLVVRQPSTDKMIQIVAPLPPLLQTTNEPSQKDV